MRRWGILSLCAAGLVACGNSADPEAPSDAELAADVTIEVVDSELPEALEADTLDAQVDDAEASPDSASAADATIEAGSDATTDSAADAAGEAATDAVGDVPIDTDIDAGVDSAADAGCEGCLITATCVPTGTKHPTNPCLECQPATNKTGWSSSPATTLCGAADTCYDATYCSAGTCPSRPLKKDSFEPNNSFAAATSTGAYDSCDTSAQARAGILSGSADSDWFSGTYTDSSTTCTLDPAIAVDSKGVVVEACVFTKCLVGKNEGMSCNDGSSANASELAGYMGCCKTGANPSFSFTPDCTQDTTFPPGDDDSSDVRIVVRKLPSATPCGPYSWNMHF
jgi:hypothetical protein